MEEWKTIINYPDYAISTYGRVYSDRSSKILRGTVNNDGYLKVTLYNSSGSATNMIHKLAAVAFLGHIPSGYDIVVDHIDNNKLNNRVDNLQLVTNRENSSKDKWRLQYTSKYLGVSWHKQRRKWRATISIDSKNNHIGLFNDEYDAHLAYQSKLAEVELYSSKKAPGKAGY